MSAASARRSVVTAGIATLVGLAIAWGLGVWQLQRLAWKQDVIARIEARTTQDPVALEAAYQDILRGEDVEYLRVSAQGSFDHSAELRFYAPGREGPGWQLLTPFHAASGAVIFVNRGYVPDARLGAAERPQDEIAISGLLRSYDRRGTFTPDNEPAANVWYWYERAAMERHLLDLWQKRNALVLYPYVLETPAREAGYPAGGATRLEIPNDHLQYAFTWFGLGLTLLGVYAVWARQRLRGE